MTLSELNRALSSKKRVMKMEAQQRATLDYILADLIGRSVGRLYSSSNSIPELAAAYPSLFDNEEIKEQKAERQAELSALRFKQFADSYNSRYKGEANKNE